jgi:hypothetical protein
MSADGGLSGVGGQREQQGGRGRKKDFKVHEARSPKIVLSGCLHHDYGAATPSRLPVLGSDGLIPWKKRTD